MSKCAGFRNACTDGIFVGLRVVRLNFYFVEQVLIQSNIYVVIGNKFLEKINKLS